MRTHKHSRENLFAKFFIAFGLKKPSFERIRHFVASPHQMDVNFINASVHASEHLVSCKRGINIILRVNDYRNAHLVLKSIWNISISIGIWYDGMGNEWLVPCHELFDIPVKHSVSEVSVDALFLSWLDSCYSFEYNLLFFDFKCSVKRRFEAAFEISSASAHFQLYSLRLQ